MGKNVLAFEDWIEQNKILITKVSTPERMWINAPTDRQVKANTFWFSEQIFPSGRVWGCNKTPFVSVPLLSFDVKLELQKLGIEQYYKIVEWQNSNWGYGTILLANCEEDMLVLQLSK